MVISETGMPDDRIAALEKKTDEMEALMKGLIAEMLDFKAIAMKLTNQSGEQSRQAPARGPTVQGTLSTAPEKSPAAPAPAAEPAENHTVIHPKSAPRRRSRPNRQSLRWSVSCRPTAP